MSMTGIADPDRVRLWRTVLIGREIDQKQNSAP
jgi:hypothetical protein